MSQGRPEHSSRKRAKKVLFGPMVSEMQQGRASASPCASAQRYLGMQVGMELVSAWMLRAPQLENEIILRNISIPFWYVLSDLFSPR